MIRNKQQLQKMKTAPGFITALDQSGGSTPGALENYGISSDKWSSDKEMFDLIHQMRTRMITSPVYGGDRIIGAILFEDTMNRTVEGKPTASYLWDVKNVVPFLKVDKGLAEENDDVQMMNPIPGLDALLDQALANNVFGTKMRSFIKRANALGIRVLVAQQFEIARQIIAKGLVPIIEPEVDIHSPEKGETESLLREAILEELDKLGSDQLVMLKLTLPEVDNFYSDCMAHSNVLKVVALSGGYSREEADAKLRKNNGVIASFSRALWQGLNVNQSDGEFDLMLDSSIESIYEASMT